MDNLNRAEDALRANLHTHLLHETTRGHMERATSHVREAFISKSARRNLATDILVVFKDFTMSLPLTRRRAKYFPDD